MEFSSPRNWMVRAVELLRRHGSVASVAIGACAVLAGTGGLPFIPDGGDPGGEGIAISWERDPPMGDPHALDDGFEHYIVTFSDGAPGDASAFPDAESSPPPGKRVVRRVPLSTNAAGEISADDLLGLSDQGEVLRIVSDGSTHYAEVEVRIAAGAGEDAPGVDTTSGDRSGDREVFGTRQSNGRDPREAALQAVPGTRTVTPVMAGTYAVVTTAGITSYDRLAGVADVDEDIVLTVAVDDPNYGDQWGLNNTGAPVNGAAGTPGADIGVEDAWVIGQGVGQVVAIVDTGVDITHPDLADAVWKNPGEICGNGRDDEGNGFVDDCNGWDFANNDSTVFDPGSDNRHATHIAGIVAAQTNNGIGVAGIAPAARIMSVKTGNSNSFRLSDGARGIAYAAANGASVINCSFGTPPGVPYDAVSTMADAIEEARAKGALVVVAAGNEGRNIDASPTYPASFPHDNLVSVGSTTNTDTPSGFSNWGPISVDLHAPGSDILSTLPGGSYGGMSGTSMATPMVVGAAALIRSVMPSLTPQEVRALLSSSSTALPSLSGLSGSGRRLDVGNILNSASIPIDEPARFTFDGFAGASEQIESNGSLRATVAPDQVPEGSNVGVRATLLSAVGGAVYGVVGAPVRLAEGTTLTDDEASVVLSPPGGFAPSEASTSMPYGFTLTPGEYALVAEAYATLDDQTLGRPWAVFFTVTAKGEPAPDPIVAPVSGGEVPSPPPISSGAGGSGAGGSGAGGEGAITDPSPTGNPWPGPLPGQWDWSSTAPSGGTDSTGGGSWSSTPSPSTPSAPWGEGWGSYEQVPTPGSGVPARAPLPSDSPFDFGAQPPGGSGWAFETPSVVGADPVPSAGDQVPLPPLPAPVTSGSLTMYGISPRQGSIGGGEVVFIEGRGFRPTLYVRFGSRVAHVLSMSSTSIAVVTPSHIAGHSDVTVAVSGGDSVTMPNAFTFVDNTAPTPLAPGGEQAAAPAPGAPSATSPPAPSPEGGSPGAPAPAPAPVPDQSSMDEAQPALPEVLPTRFTFGPFPEADATQDVSAGVRLRPVLGLSPLSRYDPAVWPSRRCRMSSCQGVRL